jgi:hypothetical protein
MTNATYLERNAETVLVQPFQYSRVGLSHLLASSAFQSGCQGNKKERNGTVVSRSTGVLVKYDFVNSLNNTLEEEFMTPEDDYFLGFCALQSGRYWPPFQRSLLSCALKMEAVNSFETSVSTYLTTRRNNPEDRDCLCVS